MHVLQYILKGHVTSTCGVFLNKLLKCKTGNVGATFDAPRMDSKTVGYQLTSFYIIVFEPQQAKQVSLSSRQLNLEKTLCDI